jgi:hypothetical protein
VPLWPPGGVPHAQGTSYDDTPELLVYSPARIRTTTGVLLDWMRGNGWLDPPAKR